MIDTHSHIYDSAFDNDRAEMIERAKSVGVEKIILPNVDSESLPKLQKLIAEYPDYCLATIGLHPTSVKDDYKKELELVKSELERGKYIAVGEIGIDLYWDKTYYKEQVFVLQQQVEWALEYQLPIIVHMRDSFRETMTALSPFRGKGLKGVFHSFTGNMDEANEIFDFGDFKLGINGIVTFKNSGLTETLLQIDLKNIVLETDAPYLTPAPFRGKRNESSYLKYVCEKLAYIYNVSFEEIDRVTTENARELFSAG
jgi:TatD DNase family protein